MFRSFAVAGLLFVGTAGTAQQPTPVAASGEKAADAADKMICKRFIQTGSLVQGTKICKTKREWEDDRSDLRSRADLSQSGALGGCSNRGVGTLC